MATVNKSSLRAEFDALKARFESLCAAGKMSADSRALFDALLMLFELLMAVFMEKHTPKSSANSSLPASQSPNDDTARTRPGAKGKGPSSNGERCANTRTREIRQGAQRRCVPALWRRPHRRRLHRPRAAHPHRHRVREGRASRRCANQALCALPHRDPGTPALLLGEGVSLREQGGESAALAGQGREPGLLPRPRARGPGASVAHRPSRICPREVISAACVTRTLIGATR